MLGPYDVWDDEAASNQDSDDQSASEGNHGGSYGEEGSGKADDEGNSGQEDDADSSSQADDEGSGGKSDEAKRGDEDRKSEEQMDVDHDESVPREEAAGQPVER